MKVIRKRFSAGFVRFATAKVAAYVSPGVVQHLNVKIWNHTSHEIGTESVGIFDFCYKSKI